MDNELTEKQQTIYKYVLEYQNKNGYPPSVREIGKAVGLKSSSTVHGYLQRLEKKGLIKRDPAKPRALQVFENIENRFNESDFIKVPVIGHVAAGTPILAVENIEEYVSLPVSLLKTEDVFILNVKGDSMINASILDGDKIIARKQNWAQNNDIVVALMDDEATVKRYFIEEDRIRLQPENKMHKPIYSRNVQILGKVIGVLRMY